MKQGRMTLVYGLGHFLVDFGCAFLLFRRMSAGGDWHMALLYYNFCAFSLQMPLGLLLDCFGHRGPLPAAAGCALAALACLPGPGPEVLCICAGLGNALFHVGGGAAVLGACGKRAGPLGLFVSPGAMGIFLGTLWGKGSGPGLFVPLLGLLAAAAAVLLFCPGEGRRRSFRLGPERGALLRLGSLFAVVCLRSALGFLFGFSWKSGLWALLFACCVVLGKTAGGYLSDRLGLRRAALLSLGAAVLLFPFAGLPPAGLAAVLLFNMSMPMTLRSAADLLPDAPGFSFGLLTFALFLGYAPFWLGGMPAFSGNVWVCAGGALLSLALLLPGLGRAKG